MLKYDLYLVVFVNGAHFNLISLRVINVELICRYLKTWYDLFANLQKIQAGKVEHRSSD